MHQFDEMNFTIVKIEFMLVNALNKQLKIELNDQFYGKSMLWLVLKLFSKATFPRAIFTYNN